MVAEAAGAAYVGAILVPGSPRYVDAAVARAVGEAVDLPLVIVVADRPAGEIAQLAADTGAGAIQLHGEESSDLPGALRELGDWELWKAVRVRSEKDIQWAAERFGGAIDLLLLDGWQAHALGGTGRVFPWETLEAVRPGLPDGLRIGVAGGLTAENVSDAVVRLAPDLVDVSSGVESGPGEKDPVAVDAFVRAALSAAGQLR